MANLKNMSVAVLLKLRSDVDAMLESKREELHAQLREIGGDASSKRGLRSRESKLAGTKVAPKYRHPETGEVWSGRGGTAGWMAAEIKAGKKKEDFLIASSSKKVAVKRTKSRKSKKA